MEHRRCPLAGVVSPVTVADRDFWCRRRVLITGHTGFKGAWLALWLERLGAAVSGVSLPAENPNAAIHALRPRLDTDAHVDIRDREALANAVREARPEVVFHLAAQAHVPAGYRDPIGTYESNVLGTVNVLAAAVDAGTRAVVVVTSDKVYANDGSGRLFTEQDALGGTDPYSASKACADIASQSWRALVAATPTSIAVARAGNVIGGGDTAADRLFPDVHRALVTGEAVLLRRPDAVRPWQFVLEPLCGYLLLAQRLLVAGEEAPVAVNFGPSPASCRPVKEVVELALGFWGTGSWTSPEGQHLHEASLLRLDSTLAERCLSWKPKLGLRDAVSLTVDWWHAAALGQELRSLALAQIAAFERVAN